MHLPGQMNFLFYSVLSCIAVSGQSNHPFVTNLGQIHNEKEVANHEILYYADKDALKLYFSKKGYSYQLVDHIAQQTNTADTIADPLKIFRVDVEFAGASDPVNVSADGTGKERLHFYCGNNEVCTGITTHERITYSEVYKNIDAVFYQANGELKYDFILRPGADDKKIRLKISGAERISLNTKGDIVLHTPLGEITEGAPMAYQNGKRIPCRWVVSGNILSFVLGSYNKNEELIIDPLMRSWGTYFGTAIRDQAYGTCTDKKRNVFITGISEFDGLTFISTPGVFQTTTSYRAAYVAKFDSLGQRLWSTYYGSNMFAYACATDTAGNIFACGMSAGTSNFTMVATAFQTVAPGIHDAFLVKLDPSGQRLWDTYYGTPNTDSGTSCATDLDGNVYMTGTNGGGGSTVLATPGAFLTTWGQAYLVKFDPAGSRIWGTYFNSHGNYNDISHCATDKHNNVYLSGQYWGGPNNATIGTPGTFQSSHGGKSDAFVSKFTPGGQQVWCTLFGGPGEERGRSCTVDPYDNVYLTGEVDSTKAPVSLMTTGCHQPAFGGGFQDGFAVKFDSTGNRVWSTFYGGSDNDEILNSYADDYGVLYICGATRSTNGISTFDAHQLNYGGCITNSGNYYGYAGGDAFVAQFDGSGKRLWSSYYGGNQGEKGYSVYSDNRGAVYLAGVTLSGGGTAIATPNSFQPTYTVLPNKAYYDSDDAFLVQFDMCSDEAPVNISSSNSVICTGKSATLTATAYAPVQWYTSIGQGAIFSGPVYTTQPLAPGTYTWYAAIKEACFRDSLYTPFAVEVVTVPIVSAAGNVICPGDAVVLTAIGADHYIYSGGKQTVFPTVNTTYTITGFNVQGCSHSAAVTITVLPTVPLQIIANPSGTICAGMQVTLQVSGASSYVWSTGLGGSSIVVNQPTSKVYTVTGLATNGCTNSAIASVSVNSCTGLDDTAQNTDLKIYPNPNSDFVILENAEQGRLSIYSSSGKLCAEKMLNSSFRLDTRDLSEGLYIFQLQTDDHFYSAKVMVLRP